MTHAAATTEGLAKAIAVFLVAVAEQTMGMPNAKEKAQAAEVPALQPDGQKPGRMRGLLPDRTQPDRPQRNDGRATGATGLVETGRKKGRRGRVSKGS